MESTETLMIPPKRFEFVKFKSKLQAFTMVLALLVIWFTFGAKTHGAFLQARNLSNLLRQMSVTGIMSVGMVLVIVAGQIDLSVGSVVCFLGSLAAVMNTNLGYSPTTTAIVTVLAGLVIGATQGYLLAYQRIPAFIVTLGGMMAFRGASMWVTSNSTVPLQENWILSLGTTYLSANLGWILSVGSIALVWWQLLRSRKASIAYGLEPASISSILFQGLSVSVLVLGFMTVLGSYEGIPTPVLVMVGLMLVGHFMATRTTWGRHIFAIGGNKQAAFVSGIPVPFRIMSIFVLMGILSAIGGMILTARVGSASPDAGQLLELDAIASCVIGGTSLTGGKGSILGAILGALVMESLNNGMSMANIEPFWQYIVKGLVLVAAVWMDMLSQPKATR